MPPEDADPTRTPPPCEGDPNVDGGSLIGGATAPLAEARTHGDAGTVVGELPAREAEVFLVPSWTDGATVVVGAERKAQRRGRKLLRDILETALLALLVFLAVRAMLQNYIVEGSSMYPTLDSSQQILVNKLAYAEINLSRLSNFIPLWDAEDGEVRQIFGGPQRGDIIVFRSPQGFGNDLIKRVIGIPGDEVAIVNGQVYINGLLLEEPYITRDWHDTWPSMVVPERHYFVLGDNRNSSQDSRSPLVGLVPRELIVGKALLTYWPFDSIGLAPNGGASLVDPTQASGEQEGP